MNAEECRRRAVVMQRDRIELIKQSPEYIDLMAEIEDAIDRNPFLYRCPNPIPRHNVEGLYEVLKSEGFSIQTNIIDGFPQDIISWYPPKDNSDDRGDTVAKIVYGDDPRFKSTGWVCRTGPRSETPVDLYGADGENFTESNHRSPLIYPDLGEGEFLMDEDETSYTIGKTVSASFGPDPMSAVGYKTTRRVVAKEKPTPIAELVNLAARDANFRRFRGMNFELCPGQYDQDIKDCRFKSSEELMKSLGLDPDFEYWGSGEYLPRQSGRTTKILVRALLNSQVCPVILAGCDRDSGRWLHRKLVEMAQSINMPIENLIPPIGQSERQIAESAIVMFDHFEY